MIDEESEVMVSSYKVQLLCMHAGTERYSEILRGVYILNITVYHRYL